MAEIPNRLTKRIVFAEGDVMQLTFPADQYEQADRIAAMRRNVPGFVLPPAWEIEWLDDTEQDDIHVCQKHGKPWRTCWPCYRDLRSGRS